MEHFVKSFSVIDFLGIFTPGALVTLAYHCYFGGVTEPFTKFFGDQPAVLVVYFVFLAYLVGILLQEASKWLEKIIYYKLDNHLAWQKNPKVRELYQEIFKEPIPDQGRPAGSGASPGGGEDPPKEAWNRIYQYVQPEVQQVKIPLFHAFTSMARSCCVAALLIMGMKWAACGADPKEIGSCLSVSGACVVIAGIMLWRCRRFHKRMIEYTYIAFIQMGAKDNRKKED